MFTTVATQKVNLNGQNCCDKKLCTLKINLPVNIFTKSSERYNPAFRETNVHFFMGWKPDKIKRETIIQDYNKGGLKTIDIEKFTWSLKISWIKRLLQTESNNLLKSIYEEDFKRFGGFILFECNFSKVDIKTHFSKKPFLKDVLLAWNSLTDKTVIYSYGNEILWNNSNIRVGDNKNQ